MHTCTSTLPCRRVLMPTQVSIQYAFRHSVRITAAATTHVLKLTGRYYVPAIEAHLLAANLTHRTATVRQARAFAPPAQSLLDARWWARSTRLKIFPLERASPRYGPL